MTLAAWTYFLRPRLQPAYHNLHENSIETSSKNQQSGWFLLILGVAGLFLPFLQGVLLLAAGLLILSSEYRWAQKALLWVQQKWSKVRLHSVGWPL